MRAGLPGQMTYCNYRKGVLFDVCHSGWQTFKPIKTTYEFKKLFSGKFGRLCLPLLSTINANKNRVISYACFKRRASHVPNALETIDNEAFHLIIYCF
jgi:hypothetical protein